MIRVQTDDFDIAAEMAQLRGHGTDSGAIVSFTGIVRAGDGARKISTMTLEHYPGMTEMELARIEAEALSRWPLQATTIIHRIGELQPGDNIVLVLTASAHRHAAFEAAEFLMDYLKTRAPIWKKEILIDGSGDWVDARDSDDNALARWQK